MVLGVSWGPHAATHQHGGVDEVGSETAIPNGLPKADSSGKLLIEWIPQGSGTDIAGDLEEETHAAEHKHGGNDEVASATPGPNEIPKADATGKLSAGWFSTGIGTDITGDVEEETHAAEHKHGGNDEVASATPGPNEIPKAEATGKLSPAWIPLGDGTDITGDLEEETHAAEHKNGGNDEVASATPGPNEIPKAEATGKLSPGWIPLGDGTDITGDLEEETHAAEHKNGGNDEVASATPGPHEIAKADATGKLSAGWFSTGIGTDITGDLEEETHAAEHKHGGNDEVASATPGPNEIPKADATGKLSAGWFSTGIGTDISADLEEETHAAEHKHGGNDEVASATPGPNAIPKADATGRLANGWLPQSATLTTTNHIPFVGSTDGGLLIDTTAAKELYRDPVTGRIGIGTTNPLSGLDVRSGIPQIHLNPLNLNNGAWLGSNGSRNFIISGGGYYDGTTFMARDTAFSGVTNNWFANGDTVFMSKTGLTAGTTFSPSYNFVVNSNGGIVAGQSYAGNTPPANGALIQGTVGIGTTGPTVSGTGKLHVSGNGMGVSRLVIGSDWSGIKKEYGRGILQPEIATV